MRDLVSLTTVPRRVGIFLDGTWNTLKSDTSVWRLKELFAPVGAVNPNERRRRDASRFRGDVPSSLRYRLGKPLRDGPLLTDHMTGYEQYGRSHFGNTDYCRNTRLRETHVKQQCQSRQRTKSPAYYFPALGSKLS